MSFFENKNSNKNKKDELFYGIGLEHEAHIFHIPKEKKKITEDLLFNSTFPYFRILENNKLKISKKDKKLLESIDLEPTGRKCNQKVVIEPSPFKMPEFISGNPLSKKIKTNELSKKSKGIEYYIKELREKEYKYLLLLSKYDKITNNQEKKYGYLQFHPFGMSNYISNPINSDSDTYKFKRTKTKLPVIREDYNGSYHITLTLPHKKSISNKKFIEMHRDFANCVQWIEPLLLTAFFTGDLKAVASSKKYTRGSYRVMMIGWGNFAGSDLRRLDKGIGRYANIDTYWRKGLKFQNLSKLSPCYTPSAPAIREGECNDLVTKLCTTKKNKKPLDEISCSQFINENKPKLISKQLKDKCPNKNLICTVCSSSLSSDFRTFGEINGEKKSGAPMIKSNGLELRIFDHFPSNKLFDLCRIILMTAINSNINKPKSYCYENKAWIKAMHKIMKDGWKAKLDDDYLKELRNQFNIKLNTKSKNAFNIFEVLVKDIFKNTKNHEWNDLLFNKRYSKVPELPRVNREAWNYSFSIKLNRNPKYIKILNNFINEIPKNKKLSKLQVKKVFLSHFDKKLWEQNFEDIIYFLEDFELCNIEYKNNDDIKTISFDELYSKNIFNHKSINLIISDFWVTL